MLLILPLPKAWAARCALLTKGYAHFYPPSNIYETRSVTNTHFKKKNKRATRFYERRGKRHRDAAFQLQFVVSRG